VDPALDELGVLLEPASILAKAWEEIDHFGRRTPWSPRTVLVTGAGPIGLLAALLGVQRGLEVHVLDRVEDGPKPQLVRDLGATYHTRPPADWDFRPDIALECSGAAPLVGELIHRTARTGLVCLVGVPGAASGETLQLGALAHDLVLGNLVVFGSVNANRRHYDAAVRALAAADRDWLSRLITRRVPMERWSEALESRPDDVKTVIEIWEPLRSRSS
jgi:threonine dehydrogenase-like Zn-dependent dehydrogenase